MIDFTPFIQSLRDSKLSSWAECLPQQIAENFAPTRYSEMKPWLAALASLPDQTPDVFNLHTAVEIGSRAQLSDSQYEALENQLRVLCPWRKGPFTLFGLHIDTEWRSDWKWQRLREHIAPLHGKTVLDVGCGNGYHCWRMLGEGAGQVIGIDPSPRFVVQFHMLKKYLPAMNVHLLPVGIQELPANLQAFDSCFSMGVLYHRRSPMDHLKQLRDTLQPGGELILETLVIEGACGEVLVPEDRYAMMNNVWFIPSVDSLLLWLRKSGFRHERCVDVCTTTVEEQRQTSWMHSHSLAQFLHPDDPSRTVEGHPAPRRAVLIANRK